jgi:hypothetical protein
MPPLSAKPVAVTTGAEKTVAFEQMRPQENLVKNTPYNVQQ